MDLSVIVINWNTRELLRSCLASLRASLAESTLTHEVIIVDNGSADGSAAMVAAEFPEFRLLANADNRCYAEGNNQGLALATGDFQLLLNSDTEVPPGALDTLVRFLREHPNAGAVAPALEFPNGELQISVRGFPTPAALFGDLTGLGRLFPRSALGGYRLRDLPLDRPTQVDQPMASAFLIRREALAQVGAFDEQFPLFFNDVDLCYRLKQAGWEVWYEPRVRIIHVGGASTGQVRPEALRQSHEGLRRYYEKHYRGKIPALVYSTIMICMSLAGKLRVALAERRK